MSYRRDRVVGIFSKVKLNVGGQYFTTTTQTLTKDPNSMLAAMVSGRFEIQPDEDDALFIDRDGTHFRFILNYLRTGKLTLPEGATFLKELEEEAEFYQIQGIINALKPPKQSVALDLLMGNIFAESTILKPDCLWSGESEEYRGALKGWLPSDLQGIKWRLLFRASRDGFDAKSFHSRCDNKGPTVVIVAAVVTGTSRDAIFGGFTEASWTSRGEYDTCSQAFLFSMNCGDNLGPTKMPLIKNQSQWAIYCNSTYGPTFGKGDLVIDRSRASSTLGSTYGCPPAQNSAFLTSHVNMNGMDYEVFGLYQ